MNFSLARDAHNAYYEAVARRQERNYQLFFYSVFTFQFIEIGINAPQTSKKKRDFK